jgi:hypothetical protein
MMMDIYELWIKIIKCINPCLSDTASDQRVDLESDRIVDLESDRSVDYQNGLD